MIDLTVSALGWPVLVNGNTLVNLTYQVRNVGTDPAQSGYRNQLYVDGRIVTDQSRPGPALAPGQTDTNGFQWRTSCGTHKVEVRTDSGNDIGESNEVNNSVCQQITVLCLPTTTGATVEK